MQHPNPYESPIGVSPAPADDQTPRSREHWTLAGFALGATVPVASGVYTLYHENLYLASLGPNESGCATGIIAAWTMIVLVGPVCGMIGAGTGLIASRINW